MRERACAFIARSAIAIRRASCWVRWASCWPGAGGLPKRATPLAGATRLLREIGAGPARVMLLCDWASAEAAAGDAAAASEALASATRVLEEAGLGVDSEVGRRVAELRATLA